MAKREKGQTKYTLIKRERTRIIWPFLFSFHTVTRDRRGIYIHVLLKWDLGKPCQGEFYYLFAALLCLISYFLHFAWIKLLHDVYKFC